MLSYVMYNGPEGMQSLYTVTNKKLKLRKSSKIIFQKEKKNKAKMLWGLS